MSEIKGASDESGRIASSLVHAEVKIAQLEHAVESRTVIGQAQGILMERLGIDAAQAFDYVCRVSSESNRKVIDIATEIARTRELPDA